MGQWSRVYGPLFSGFPLAIHRFFCSRYSRSVRTPGFLRAASIIFVSYSPYVSQKVCSRDTIPRGKATEIVWSHAKPIWCSFPLVLCPRGACAEWRMVFCFSLVAVTVQLAISVWNAHRHVKQSIPVEMVLTAETSVSVGFPEGEWNWSFPVMVVHCVWA